MDDSSLTVFTLPEGGLLGMEAICMSEGIIFSNPVSSFIPREVFEERIRQWEERLERAIARLKEVERLGDFQKAIVLPIDAAFLFFKGIITVANLQEAIYIPQLSLVHPTVTATQALSIPRVAIDTTTDKYSMTILVVEHQAGDTLYVLKKQNAFLGMFD